MEDRDELFNEVLEELCLLSAEDFEASIDRRDPSLSDGDSSPLLDSTDDAELDEGVSEEFWLRSLELLENTVALKDPSPATPQRPLTLRGRAVEALGVILFSSSDSSGSPLRHIPTDEPSPMPSPSSIESPLPTEYDIPSQLSAMQTTLDAVLLHLRAPPPSSPKPPPPIATVDTAARMGSASLEGAIKTWMVVLAAAVLGFAIGQAVGSSEVQQPGT